MGNRFAAVLASLALAGCVSTGMKSLVGSPIQEAQIKYGPPAQIIDMPDGRKAYQFRYGGGPVPVPGYQTTTAQVVGSTVTATTVGSPGMVVDAPGCLLTFIAAQRGGVWMIEDIRVPKGLVC